MTARSSCVRGAAASAAALLAVLACQPPERAPVYPTEDEAQALFAEHGGLLSASMNGNVLELEIRQPSDQLRRGGSLWARVGPYVYLFTPSTRAAFERYPDVAAVRVITLGPVRSEVARAMLRRDALSEIEWRRSLNLLGHALREGTQRPTRLEALIAWGERHTHYEYSDEFVN